MRSLVKPGARNIKKQLTVPIQKGLVKRLTVQEEKNDRAEEKQKVKVFLKE